MPQLHLSLSVVVATLVAILLSFTRVANASKPLWGMLPGWMQVALPQALVVATALVQKLADTTGVQTWTDFIVVLVTSFALLGPGMPSHRSSAPLPNNSKPVPPLAIVSMLGILGGLLALVAGIALCVSLSACSTAQLDADLHKVEVCAEDPRVDACVVAVGEGAPEPSTALACVQMCLADPAAKSFRLAKPVTQ